MRIGKLAFASGVLRSASISSPQGSVLISLPFAAGVVPNGAVGVGHFMSWAGGLSNVTGIVSGSAIILYKDGTANTVAAADLNPAAWANFIRFSALYEVA
jgi:hypothetical protein